LTFSLVNPKPRNEETRHRKYKRKGKECVRGKGSHFLMEIARPRLTDKDKAQK